jgi:hypothetical protein
MDVLNISNDQLGILPSLQPDIELNMPHEICHVDPSCEQEEKFWGVFAPD